MDVASHFYLYRRNWLAIFIITALVAAGTYAAASRTAQKYETTLFLNIGTQQNPGVSTSFDDVQAADYFADTVQGWFKNPQLLLRIEENARASAQLSARKQEKQNLLVTWSSASEEEAGKIAEATIEELRLDILDYNTATESTYTLAIVSTTISEATAKTVIFIILGIIVGLALGIGFAYLYEMLFGVVSFRHQAEKVLKKKSDETLRPGWKKRELEYLQARIEKLPHKKSVLLGVNVDCNKVAQKLKGKIAPATFPEESREIADNKNIILLCQLGKTTTENLEKVRLLLPENYLLVTLYSR